MNELGISFLDHIMVLPFKIQDQKAQAVLNFNNQKTDFDIFYKEIENYTLVYANRKQ